MDEKNEVEVQRDFWRTIATIEATLLMACLGFWFAWARDAATIDYVDRNAPWVKERAAVMTALNNLQAANERLLAKMQEVDHRIARVEIAIAKIKK